MTPLQLRWIVQAVMLVLAGGLVGARFAYQGYGRRLLALSIICSVCLLSYLANVAAVLALHKTPARAGNDAMTRWGRLNYYLSFMALLLMLVVFFVQYGVVVAILLLILVIMMVPFFLYLDALLDQGRAGSSMTPAQLVQACGYCAQAYKDGVTEPVQHTRHTVVTATVDGVDTLVIGFAGTRVKEIKTVRSDVNILTGIYTPNLAADTDAAALIGPAGVSCQRGFLEAYMAVRVELLRSVTSAVAAGVHRVLVTGHSLGGALAALCALDLACNSSATGLSRQDLQCITVAAPAFASQYFSTVYPRLVPYCTRVFAINDPVPQMISFQFAHVGVPYRLVSVEYSVPAHLLGSYAKAAGKNRHSVRDFRVYGAVTGTVAGVLVAAMAVCIAMNIRRPRE